jgi:hypothetical protein
MSTDGSLPQVSSAGSRRIWHSLWLAVPFLSCGLLGGLGLVYVGIRARKRSWWIAGVVYLVVVTGSFSISGSVDPESPTYGWVLQVPLTVLLVCICHCIVVNGGWLRWWAARASAAGTAPLTMANDRAKAIPASQPSAALAVGNPVKVFDRRTITLLTIAGLLGFGSFGFLVALDNAAKGSDPLGAGEALGFLSMAAIPPAGSALILLTVAVIRMSVRYNPWPPHPAPIHQ